jgi:hypothetical protein
MCNGEKEITILLPFNKSLPKEISDFTPEQNYDMLLYGAEFILNKKSTYISKIESFESEKKSFESEKKSFESEKKSLELEIEQLKNEKLEQYNQLLDSTTERLNNIYSSGNTVDKKDENTKKNIIGYRNIYLICKDPSIRIDGTITIDERIFPFSIDDVANSHGKRERNGWYLQQLLKLYAGVVIPDILQRYLVIDSDTYFLKPTKFLTDDNKMFLTEGYQYHEPYFPHMNRLYPNLKKIHPSSGIAHHMFFDSELVKELFKKVEDFHIHSRKKFWQIFLDEVDTNFYHGSGSGASEYEIYFTYVYLYHPEKIEIRRLNWNNANTFDENCGCDFTSVHWWMR